MSHSRFPVISIAMLVAGAPATSLFAEPATEDRKAGSAALTLDQLTISATRQVQPIDQVPSTVAVHDRTQLDRDNVNTIGDVVRYEPGVSVGGAGQRSGISGYNIRGIDGNRVLTQVDGVEIPNGYFNGPYAKAQRNYVDPEILKRVEILRGPASVLYGSNAIGGAVSYFTLDPQDIIKPGKNHGARLKSGYGSADSSWLNSATVAAREGDIDGLLHFSQRNGHERASYGEIGGTGLDRTAANAQEVRTSNILAKSGWTYAEGARFSLTYEKYTDDRDGNEKSSVGGPFVAGQGLNLYRGRLSNDTISRERFGVAHELTLQSALADHLKWSLNYQIAKTDQHTAEDYAAGRRVLRVRDTLYQERQWVLDVQADKAFAIAGTDHHVTYGTTLKHDKVTGSRSGYGVCLNAVAGCARPGIGGQSPADALDRVSDFPDPDVNTFSLFAQDRISWNRWTLLPGARYDYTRLTPRLTDAFLDGLDPNRPDTPADDAKTWHRISPKLGITYAFNDHYTGYGQYAEGFRTPTAKMLYGRYDNPAGGYLVQPNPDLAPETSRSYELGLRGRFDRGRFDAAIFHNQYRDFINEDAVTPGADKNVFQANNIKRATIQGIEFKGHLDLDLFGAPQGLYTQGSLSYLYGRNDDTGRPLNSINPLTGVLGLGYAQADYGSLLSWTLVKRKNRVDNSKFFSPDGHSSQFKTPGFGILDLTGFYKVNRDVTLSAGLYNLTDKKYWLWDDVRGYNGLGEAAVVAPANLDRLTQPGRNFSVNLVWDI